MSAGKSNEDKQTTSKRKLCPVCGELSRSKHFGVDCCTSCRDFFVLTVRNSRNYECSSNKNCKIDTNGRYECDYCRYKKCLEVGMIAELVPRSTRNRSVYYNESCRVCGVTEDEQVGFRYGTIACNYCAAFFKRTLDPKRLRPCKNNQNCVINKQTRTLCSYCRYQACLKVGMKLGATESETVTPEVDNSKQCNICGDNDAISRYGKIMCTSCIKFFNNTVSNKKVYDCQSKSCVITTQNRACNYCRFNKCIEIGIVPTFVRPGLSYQPNKSNEDSENEAKRMSLSKTCIVCTRDIDRPNSNDVSICEPCISFFINSSNYDYSSTCCPTNGNCTLHMNINCKYCHYKACLKAGMEKMDQALFYLPTTSHGSQVANQFERTDTVSDEDVIIIPSDRGPSSMAKQQYPNKMISSENDSTISSNALNLLNRLSQSPNTETCAEESGDDDIVETARIFPHMRDLDYTEQQDSSIATFKPTNSQCEPNIESKSSDQRFNIRNLASKFVETNINNPFILDSQVSTIMSQNVDDSQIDSTDFSSMIDIQNLIMSNTSTNILDTAIDTIGGLCDTANISENLDTDFDKEIPTDVIREGSSCNPSIVNIDNPILMTLSQNIDNSQTNIPSPGLSSLPGSQTLNLSATSNNDAEKKDVSDNKEAEGSCKDCDGKDKCLNCYGEVACRSCREFFLKTIYNKINYKCFWEGNCEINEHTRANCPHCRFKKCLKIGMKEEQARAQYVPRVASTCQVCGVKKHLKRYRNVCAAGAISVINNPTTSIINLNVNDSEIGSQDSNLDTVENRLKRVLNPDTNADNPKHDLFEELEKIDAILDSEFIEVEQDEKSCDDDLCRVCGGEDACLNYYGEKSCRSCRDFFQKTVCQNKKYTCFLEGNCEVNKFTRLACSYCRYKKCLKVGMKEDKARVPYVPKRKHRPQTNKIKTCYKHGKISCQSCASSNIGETGVPPSTSIISLNVTDHSRLSKTPSPITGTLDSSFSNLENSPSNILSSRQGMIINTENLSSLTSVTSINDPNPIILDCTTPIDINAALDEIDDYLKKSNIPAQSEDITRSDFNELAEPDVLISSTDTFHSVSQSTDNPVTLGTTTNTVDDIREVNNPPIIENAENIPSSSNNDKLLPQSTVSPSNIVVLNPGDDNSKKPDEYQELLDFFDWCAKNKQNNDEPTD